MKLSYFSLVKFSLFFAVAVFISGCELGVDKLEEPQPLSNGSNKSFGGFPAGGSINVPVGVNIVSFANANPLYSTFRLSTGLYLSSGILTRSGITIIRNNTSAVPRIKGWMDVRGANNVINGLTWDGDDWADNDAIGDPGALVHVSGQNVTVEYCTFRDIDNLEDIVLIWAGVTSNQIVHETVNVSNLKIQYNNFTNWKHVTGYITAVQFGSFTKDVPPALGAHIRWNTFSNGPTAGGYGSSAGNPAIVLADDVLPYFTGYNPHAYQPINVQGNNISGGWDAMSIKVNNCVVRYNVISNSNSGSSPGIQNRFGSWNIFEGNLVSGASGPGIMIWSGDGLTFRNNVIRDSNLGVLFIARKADTQGVAGEHILLTNNTFVRNIENVKFDPSSGATYSPHDDVVFVNNIFYKKNGATSTSFREVSSHPTYNIWTSISYMGYNIFANGFAKPSTGTCHSCQEPASTVQIFDNVGTNNFDLETGSSPAVNAGVTWSNGMPTEDFERKNRPVSTYDIGALEKNGY